MNSLRIPTILHPLKYTKFGHQLTHKRKIRPYKPSPLYAQKPDDNIRDWLEHNRGCQVTDVRIIGTSNWSSQYCYVTSDDDDKKGFYFIKTAYGSDLKMFEGEALGLQALAYSKTLIVPNVYHYGLLANGNQSFIVMDHLNIKSGVKQADLAKALAMMHLSKPKDENAQMGKFGFPIDNTIGGTSQPNGWMDNWIDFFRERRLKHQLDLAGDITLSKMGEKLMNNLEKLFEGIEIKPSVLHGDLWSGNYGSVDKLPAVFDPAVYYGHYEAEFGMSWCASFNNVFWDAYHEIIPEEPGFEKRHRLYQLYHYLNHYNLFGSGYYSSCQSILASLTKNL